MYHRFPMPESDPSKMDPRGSRLAATESVILEDASRWWSFQPIHPPAVPGNSHPIDAFLLSKLQDQGLSFSPPTDARTLCRRLFYDLHGLPPTPEQVAEFEADYAVHSERAMRKWIDNLLQSPRYGERWGRYWLDIVHYGDTHGYDKDQPRPHAWPYRDYVIRAFNEDKPYGRFIEEQIAGDVLFPETKDGVEALGFLAAGPWDLIGHAEVPEAKVDGKIARHLDRDDIVANAMGTFCSVTVHCAQCHNHKFDPISQEDYYALQAIFAAIDRTNKSYDSDPSIALLRQQLETYRTAFQSEIKAIEMIAAKQGGEKYKALSEKIQQTRTKTATSRPSEHGWHSAISRNQHEQKWVELQFERPVVLSKIVLIGAADDYNNIGEGFGFPLRFEIAVDSANQDDASAWEMIYAHTERDFANPVQNLRLFPVMENPFAQYASLRQSWPHARTITSLH